MKRELVVILAGMLIMLPGLLGAQMHGAGPGQHMMGQGQKDDGPRNAA